MNLSHKTVAQILERWSDEGIVTDYCAEYGEPGYEHSLCLTDEDTPMVVLGSFWCRCGELGNDNTLHGHSDHHPQLWAQLESQGVQFEWYDEWTVDHENDKAYRTQPDSYLWQPSIAWTEGGEILTPDDDIDTWVAWAVNTASRCIPSNVWSAGDLEAVGFEKHNGQYESGFHPGQNDDPSEILSAMQDRYGLDTDIVFLLDSTGQFDMAFSAYYRQLTTEDE